MIPQKNPLIASGESVHANMLTKLWENPNPSVAFATQNINFSSDDYDFTFWIFRYSTGDSYTYSECFPKGTDTLIRTTGTTAAAYTNTHQRAITRVSDTEYTIGSNYEQASNGNRAVNNIFNYPLAVYGFKKSLDITAIVSNVSTDATKCILSDNVTNVDDAIDGMTWKYLDTTTGNAEIAIPANATEVYARASNSSTSCSFHFLTVENDISVDRAAGYYGGASNYFNAAFMWTKSTRKAKMYSFVFAGTDYTSTTTTKWYYKTK